MSTLFSQDDLLLFIRLIISHVIVDFLFQMDSRIKDQSEKKWTSNWLYLHGAIAGVSAYIFAGLWTAIALPLVISVSHILLDGFKSNYEDTARLFLLDQFGHVLVIVGCWLLLIDVNMAGVAGLLVSLMSDAKIWIFILSYMIVICPTGVLISKVMEPWRKEMKKASSQGLDRAGLWIGYLERILILTFVLLNQFEAIGFLIAAKSIFRFGEIKSRQNRKEAEYILIGTMVSFVIAIILGLCMSWVLH